MKPVEPKTVDHITNTLRDTLDRLLREGYDPSLILAAAHAEAVALVSASYGGIVAAQMCEKAADRVRGLPTQADAELARVPCAGRA